MEENYVAQIEKTNENLLLLNCVGSVNMKIYSELCMIQEIRGCRISEMS